MFHEFFKRLNLHFNKYKSINCDSQNSFVRINLKKNVKGQNNFLGNRILELNLLNSQEKWNQNLAKKIN